MKKLSLGMIGLLCILGGVGSGAITAAVSGPPANASEAMGRGAAQLVFAIVGIVLIIVHFVRRRG